MRNNRELGNRSPCRMSTNYQVKLDVGSQCKGRSSLPDRPKLNVSVVRSLDAEPQITDYGQK
jgi:hypothetical protein